MPPLLHGRGLHHDASLHRAGKSLEGLDSHRLVTIDLVDGWAGVARCPALAVPLRVDLPVEVAGVLSRRARGPLRSARRGRCLRSGSSRRRGTDRPRRSEAFRGAIPATIGAVAVQGLSAWVDGGSEAKFRDEAPESASGPSALNLRTAAAAAAHTCIDACERTPTMERCPRHWTG